MKKIISIFLIFISIYLLIINNPQYHQHEYTNVKLSYMDYHIMACVCGAEEQQEHQIIEATCTTNASCSVCKCEFSGLELHEYTTLKHDTESHWLECVCGDKSNIEVHSGGIATCTESAVCETCNTSYGEVLPHNYETLKHDTESHWLECICGDFINVEQHTFADGKITLEPTDKTNGIKGYDCLNCQYIKEETIPMILGHEVEHYPHLSNADIVYYEGNIYTYGGNASGRTKAIYRYNISTDKLYRLDAELKSESTSHRVVLVGDKVYIFGGLSNNGRLQTILIHDLINQKIEEADVKVPFGINCFQVGYYENKIYLIAGSTSNGNSNKIYQFDLETQLFTELSPTLPSVVFKGAWCFAGKYAYVIGGTNGKRLTSIYRFDMETHEVATMNGVLPYQISQSRAAFDGEGNIIIYGGTNESNKLVDDVFIYNIALDVCTKADYDFPQVIANTCVVNTGDGIYILGGDNAYVDIIYKHKGNEIVAVRESILLV